MAGRRVLVLGSAAREHALAWRLARDPSVREVRVGPGNAGTAAFARNLPAVDPSDPASVVGTVRADPVDLVVIGPEAPLAAGVADALTAEGVAVFGPSRAAARLEWSKGFAKQQMRLAGVPTAAARWFASPDAAVQALDEGPPPVVKADGLAAGKGVLVADTIEEARAALARLSGSVVLEERLSGPEVSVFAFVSGKSVVPVVAARDAKRLLDGDGGPNTGGMGAHSPVPGFGAAELEWAVEKVFEPIAWQMARSGAPYRGVLYAGLILTDGGPMVLEFNARFGDPEAQVVLPLIDGDLGDALAAIAADAPAAAADALSIRPGAAVGVVLASPGYPDDPTAGLPVSGATPATPNDDASVLCFHASTSRADDGSFCAPGGRVVTVVGLAGDLAGARERAYAALAEINLPGGRYRSDIGLYS